jgi:hypothetical protein
MEFKTFFVKKVMMSFFVSVICISAAMALIGMSFDPDACFGYEASVRLRRFPRSCNIQKRTCP